MLHQVVTTEKVPITYRVAGMGSRFLAWLIDLGPLAVLAAMGAGAAAVLETLRPGVGIAAELLWIFTLRWGYFLFFEWLWSGQTPGKRLIGLRVLQMNGTSISFVQAALRNVVRVADGLPFFYALGFVVAACNRHQRQLVAAQAQVEQRLSLTRDEYQSDEKFVLQLAALLGERSADSSARETRKRERSAT